MLTEKQKLEPTGSHGRGRVNNSEAVEDYAKAIYSMSGRVDGPIGTSAIADRLGVAPGTVTAMLKRMSSDGLVSYEPYQGVELTERGRLLALEVIRHHRLLELFLAEIVGMPWDRVHDEAEVLEHYISEDLEARIDSVLGNPSHDPHGDPIPDRDLDIAADDSIPLGSLGPDGEGTFVRVSDSDPGMLRYLADRGIEPGKRLIVRSHEPYGGPFMVEVEGTTHPLGRDLVAAMRVEGKG